MAEKVKKAQVAKHELLDASGTVVETEELATGMRYTLLAAPQSPIEWQSGFKAGTPGAMDGVFSRKTLATNVSSQVRQAGEDDSPESQLSAIKARFALIDSGVWLDRTRETFKPDPTILVEAFIDHAVADGKVTQEQVDSVKRAEWLAKATVADSVWAKNAYGIAAVKEAYAKRIGKSVKTVDDLL